MLILHHQKTCKSYGALFVRNLALVQYYKAEVNQILIAVRFWQGLFHGWQSNPQVFLPAKKAMYAYLT